MGADNWAVCPRCEKKLENERLALAEKIGQVYGKVSETEYLALLEDYEAQKLYGKPTLREDWELGIWDSVLKIKYYAECSRCGFSKVFEHREVIEL